MNVYYKIEISPAGIIGDVIGFAPYPHRPAHYKSKSAAWREVNQLNQDFKGFAVFRAVEVLEVEEIK